MVPGKSGVTRLEVLEEVAGTLTSIDKTREQVIVTATIRIKLPESLILQLRSQIGHHIAVLRIAENDYRVRSL